MLTYNSLQTGLKDPAIQSRWRVIMPDVQPLLCIAESVEVVFRGVGAKARRGQAKVKYYPEESDIDTLNIVFYETADYDVLNYLTTWRGQIRHKNASYGLPSDYERDIFVQFLAIDSNDVIKTLKYKGVWPIDPSPISLNYEDPNARIQISASFRVDDVEEEN